MYFSENPALLHLVRHSLWPTTASLLTVLLLLQEAPRYRSHIFSVVISPSCLHQIALNSYLPGSLLKYKTKAVVKDLVMSAFDSYNLLNIRCYLVMREWVLEGTFYCRNQNKEKRCQQFTADLCVIGYCCVLMRGWQLLDSEIRPRRMKLVEWPKLGTQDLIMFQFLAF